MFETLLYQPLFNLLIFLYNTIPGENLGLAIIVLTILIKLALFPLSLKSIKSQKLMQDLQPKLEELKEKYKGQKEKLAQETMALYKQQKINPLSSCLPLLIQLPFLIAVYRVFMVGLKSEENFSLLYSFVQNPGTLNHMFLGFMDLSVPFIPLALVTAAVQFWQTKMLMHKKQPKVKTAKDEGMMAMMNKQMLYFMPVMTFIIGVKFPSGLVLYWLVVTLLTGLQQVYFLKKKEKQEGQEVQKV